MRIFLFITTLMLAPTMLIGQKTLATMKEIAYKDPVSFLQLDNGIEIAYTEQGEGEETILFVHGLASNITSWNKNIAELKTNKRCIAIDLPGYGKSSKGNYVVSMDFFAEIIAQVAKSFKIEKITLAGHSMGGQIAIATALKYPNLVEKLILIAPAGFETFNKGQRQWFRDVMTVDGVKLTTAEQIRVNYAYNFFNMPPDAQFMVDDRLLIREASDFNDYCYHIVQGVNAMVDQPVFNFLPKVLQPTLCIFGTNDNLIPNRFLHGGFTKKFALKGAQQMPNCKLEMVDKAGHFVMFEQANAVNQHIASFLK